MHCWISRKDDQSRKQPVSSRRRAVCISTSGYLQTSTCLVVAGHLDRASTSEEKADTSSVQARRTKTAERTKKYPTRWLTRPSGYSISSSKSHRHINR